MNEKNWLGRPFFHLFHDAIQLAMLSRSISENIENGDSISRSSILSSIFALEGAANSLLESYETSKYLYKAFEKFGVLEKYEFLLSVKTRGVKFDRGRIEVQKVSELISLRNAYVHPKSLKSAQKYKQSGPIKPIGSTYELSKKSPLTQFLEIPEDSDEWNSEHAKIVINAVADFLSLFLIGLCELTPKEATQYLCDELFEDDEYKIMLSEECLGKIAHIHETWGTNIQFIEPSYVYRNGT
jgi:hypothetical protein